MTSFDDLVVVFSEINVAVWYPGAGMDHASVVVSSSVASSAATYLRDSS